jgi:hypothetical protein
MPYDYCTCAGEVSWHRSFAVGVFRYVLAMSASARVRLLCPATFYSLSLFHLTDPPNECRISFGPSPCLDSFLFSSLKLIRSPLSLVSTTEELLGRKSRGSGLENRDYGHRNPSR